MGRRLKYSLPKALEEHLIKLGWDVRTLAKVAGVNEQRLYNNLSGENPMSLDVALKIVKALQLDSPENQAIKLLKQIQAQTVKHKESLEQNPE
jgi:plasmid maintenance system antidote protein VapI